MTWMSQWRLLSISRNYGHLGLPVKHGISRPFGRTSCRTHQLFTSNLDGHLVFRAVFRKSCSPSSRRRAVGRCEIHPSFAQDVASLTTKAPQGDRIRATRFYAQQHRHQGPRRIRLVRATSMGSESTRRPARHDHVFGLALTCILYPY